MKILPTYLVFAYKPTDAGAATYPEDFDFIGVTDDKAKAERIANDLMRLDNDLSPEPTQKEFDLLLDDVGEPNTIYDVIELKDLTTEYAGLKAMLEKRYEPSDKYVPDDDLEDDTPDDLDDE